MAVPPDARSHLDTILRRAAEIALNARKELKAELKADLSIVTNADRAVETSLRTELVGLVPGSTVWGEEEGWETPGDAGLWLVDPIDGTSNFRFGSPLWGISVALLAEGRLQLGGVFLPDLDEMYLAECGNGATRNGEPLPQLEAGPVKPSELVSYTESTVNRIGSPNLPGKMRLSGAFVIDGTFVACGRLRGLIGEGEHLYDVAACVLINRELGADIRYANGDPFDEAAVATPVKLTPPWLIFPPESGFFA